MATNSGNSFDAVKFINDIVNNVSLYRAQPLPSLVVIVDKILIRLLKIIQN